MKEWPGGSHIFMKSTPRVIDDRPLMAIGYKYRSQKFLGFIATEGGVSNVPVVPYLSCCFYNYLNVSICLIFFIVWLTDISVPVMKYKITIGYVSLT